MHMGVLRYFEVLFHAVLTKISLISGAYFEALKNIENLVNVNDYESLSSSKEY